MKKSLFIAASGLIIVGAAALPVIASAQSNIKASHHTVFVHRVRENAKLNQAVRDDVITQAQADAFRTELKQLKFERKTDLSKSSTKTDRIAERTKIHNELKTWATNNSFPLSKIFPKLAS